MNVSSLTISQKTQEEIEKGLNNRQIGKLRLRKLREVVPEQWLSINDARKILGQHITYPAMTAWLDYQARAGFMEKMGSGEFSKNGKEKQLYRVVKSVEQVQQEKVNRVERKVINSSFNKEVELLTQAKNSLKDKSSEYKCGYYEALIDAISKKYLLNQEKGLK